MKRDFLVVDFNDKGIVIDQYVIHEIEEEEVRERPAPTAHRLIEEVKKAEFWLVFPQYMERRGPFRNTQAIDEFLGGDVPNGQVYRVWVVNGYLFGPVNISHRKKELQGESQLPEMRDPVVAEWFMETIL